MPEDKAQLQQLLLRRFTYAESDRRQNYDEIASEAYKAYIGYREPLPEGVQRSNIHIPRTYEYIDTLRARYLKSLLGSRPYIDFIPVGQTLEIVQTNSEKAELAAAFLDSQLERNCFPAVLYDFITSALVFPVAVMSVGWRYEKRKVRRRIYDQKLNTYVERESEEVVWDDNELQHIPWGNFWWDPMGSDIDSCRYVFQRTYETQEQIEARLNLLKERGKGKVYELDWERLRRNPPPGTTGSDSPFDVRQAVGQSPASPSDDGTEYTQKGTPLFEVLHYWTDDEHGILVNRELAYYGDSPYWRHGKKPFVAAVFERLPTGEFAGRSAVAQILGLQAETNTLRNQVIDNRSMVINRMWWLRDESMDESELVSRAHGVIHGRWNEDFGPIDMPDVTGNVFRDDMQNRQDMENALGVPPAQRGATTDRQQTATEIVTQASSAGIRFDVKIMMFEAVGLKRLAYLMDCNNQQFIDDKRLVRLSGSDDNEWREVGPGDLIGEWDYRPAGSSVDPAANPEIRRQQLMELRERMKDSPHIDHYELDRMILQSYGLKNVEKIMLPKQELVPPTEAPAIPIDLPPGGETPLPPMLTGGGQ